MIGRMQTFAFCQSLGDFRVTVHALERSLPGRELVATAAIGGSVARLVSSGEGARRDLRTYA